MNIKDYFKDTTAEKSLIVIHILFNLAVLAQVYGKNDLLDTLSKSIGYKLGMKEYWYVSLFVIGVIFFTIYSKRDDTKPVKKLDKDGNSIPKEDGTDETEDKKLYATPELKNIFYSIIALTGIHLLVSAVMSYVYTVEKPPKFLKDIVDNYDKKLWFVSLFVLVLMASRYFGKYAPEYEKMGHPDSEPGHHGGVEGMEHPDSEPGHHGGVEKMTHRESGKKHKNKKKKTGTRPYNEPEPEKEPGILDKIKNFLGQ